MEIKYPFLLLILLTLYSATLQQHIFEETCVYVVKNSTEVLRLASQVLQISNRRHDVVINVCKGLGRIDSACDLQSRACIKRKNGATYIRNAAVNFEAYLEYENSTQSNITVLEATTKQRQCSDGLYSFKIYLKKTITTNEVQFSDECSMEIAIPHPSVQVRGYAFAYNGFVLDMSPLQAAPEVFIERATDRVALAACRPAPSCHSPTASICEISQGGHIFTVAESQHVVYDDRTNVLMLRGRKTQGKLKSEVTVNCNWTATFDNPRKLAARYKYSVDSKFGCVKVPLDCEFEDLQRYVYDLSMLNKHSGWPARNLSRGNVLINVCGKLLLQPSQKLCTELHSQACYQLGSKYLSYGALSHKLQFDGDDITLEYSHGSQCPHNASQYLNTKIRFLCSANETGPIISSMINCTMNINWETMHACPKDIADDASFSFGTIQKQIKRTRTLSCSVFVLGREISLSSLITNQPQEFIGQNNLKYYINICRPLAVNKNNYFCNLAGACIEKLNEVNKKKRFITFSKITNPQIKDEDLFIRYTGDYCVESASKVFEIFIHFGCSHTKEPLKLLNETACRTDFQWSVPQACFSRRHRASDCIVRSSNTKENLFDFRKSIFQEINILHQNTNYTFSMCRSSLRDANAADEIPLNSELTVGIDCNYTIIYRLPNASCDASNRTLQSIRLNFFCDHVSNNNDHIGGSVINNCEAVIALKSSEVCSKTHDCMALRELEYTSTDEAESLRESESQCKIIRNGNELQLKSLHETRIQNSSDVFLINGKCAGFICKNNITIGSLDVCPNVVLNAEEKMIELHFVGPACLNNYHVVRVRLYCASEPKMFVEENTDCKTHFIIQDNSTCHLYTQSVILNETKTYFNFAALLIGIIILFASLVLTWTYRRRFQHKCCGYTNTAGYYKTASE